MSTDSDFLEIEDLTITFSQWGQTVNALDGITFNVPRGQWLMITGHNGSGKSTLLRAISGRIQANKGKVMICGQNVSGLSASSLAANTFHVHQAPLLGTAPSLTVFENLLVADHTAELIRASKRTLVFKYDEMLEPLGLRDRMKQPVESLSGGERQILALLIARLRPSSLILLDEPLAALDPLNAEIGLSQIKELKRLGKTLIHVTHNQEHARTLGDRTLVFAEGRVIFDKLGQPRPLDLNRRSAVDILVGG